MTNQRDAAEAVAQMDRDFAASLMPCNTIAECERVADVKAGRHDNHPLIRNAIAYRLASLPAATEQEPVPAPCMGMAQNCPWIEGVSTSCSCQRPAPSDQEKLDDTALMTALRDESWDLRCFDVPTGGGDADIGWRVVGHWMAEPRERTIAEVFHDSPRDAVREALRISRARQTGFEG